MAALQHEQWVFRRSSPVVDPGWNGRVLDRIERADGWFSVTTNACSLDGDNQILEATCKATMSSYNHVSSLEQAVVRTAELQAEGWVLVGHSGGIAPDVPN